MQVPSIPSDTIKEMKAFLQSINVTHSFRSKDEYLSRIDKIKTAFTFPWRKDQKDVIEAFLKQTQKYYVVNGIFGCGKTSMIMGIHVQSVVNKLYRPEEAMFLSFNVCIKNELIQKLRGYGMSSKTDVRTFDSIIYEICKKYDYPYMDLPNYEGKRKFIYKVCSEINCEEKPLQALSVNPRFIFIDECQDLEHQTFNVFQTFFPDAQVIFTGDIFQSIQKEPRESLLWYLLNNEKLKNISRHYMKETPRVPVKMLENVKGSLKKYYPEFIPEIDQWHSSSKDECSEIEWHRFYNYSELHKKMDEFLEKYPPEKSMILTFSSAITVKGAMGDLARIRRYLVNKGISVNNNHKKMDHDRLFLSTVNSSKGLERDYVFVMSTFPLERAFVNFSYDLVVNLVTVGVTRSKHKVIFYVPAFPDKFSKTFENYQDCPRPDKDKIREGKIMDEFTFSDYLYLEHSVTELIRQSIIKYDTRIRLREYTKKYDTTYLFPDRIPYPKISTEEERAFVGVLLENLITSSWAGYWPNIGDDEGIEKLRHHPMYTHCFKKIEDRYKNYYNFIKKNPFNKEKSSIHFQGIYYYTQIHIAMYNKLMIEFRQETQSYLLNYWDSIRYKMYNISPRYEMKEEDDKTKMMIQMNMKMPWLTGISDVVFVNETDQVTIWELKASSEADWADDALTQAMLYASMTGKTNARLILLNPFRNEKISYYFNMKKIMEIRDWVMNDIISWNINCYLSKQIKSRGKTLDVTNQLFLSISSKQYTLLQFMSPTKIDILSNVYFKNESGVKKEENKKKENKKEEQKRRAKMSTLEKLCYDSEVTRQEGMKYIRELLNTPAYRDKKVYVNENDSKEFKEDSRFMVLGDITGLSISELNESMDVKNIQTEKISLEESIPKLDKEKEKRNYHCDLDNTMISSLIACGYLAKEYKLV